MGAHQSSVLNHTNDYYGTSTHHCLYNWRRDLPNKKDVYNFRHDTLDTVDAPNGDGGTPGPEKASDAADDSGIDSSPALAARVDMRKALSAIYDQRGLGSSTVHALRVMLESKFEFGMLSSMFMYYTARDEDGTIPCDAGVCFRTAMRAVDKYGLCACMFCPYDVRHFRGRPSQDAYTMTIPVTLAPERVPQELSALKYHLANGSMVAFGMAVYDSFESAAVFRTGKIPLPQTDEEAHLGGHAMVLVGYDDHDDHFIVRNSWGTHWGDSGYGYIPYAYVTDAELCSDLWILGANTSFVHQNGPTSSADDDDDSVTSDSELEVE